MGSMRRTFIVLASFAVCAVVIFVSYSTDQIGFVKPSQVKWMIDKHGFLVDTEGCRIPTWDPYDPSVTPFIEAVAGPYKCPGKPSFFNIKPNAVVSIDETILQFYYGLTRTNISCSYKPIIRDPGPDDKPTDNKFRLGPSAPLNFDVPLEEDFIRVNCFMGNWPPFLEYLPLVPIKADVERKCDEATEKAVHEGINPENLNIIVVGIDSVSKLNFLRHFRKTYHFLREKLNPIELHGYTKVADNTFPNLVPLLTGQFVEYYWNESLRYHMFFDSIDLIWKNYSERGYRTLLAEDAPNIATFNYLKKGFRNPPTDYYLRPFALAVEKSQLKSQSKAHCFQAKMEMEVYYDYLRNFVYTMDHRPFFAFTFIARLTHDKLNAAGYADEPTFLLLRDLHQSGVLNRSVLVFMSDHGIRFGGIRQTYIGKVEERMPFMFLHFPDWFLNTYPEFAANLRKNQRRLTTPFDIHATLSHLLNVSAPSFYTTSRGISLFSEIPSRRKCSDASILLHWCACQAHTPVSLDNEMVLNAAEALIDTINDWIKGYKDFCATLKVRKVLDARVGRPNEEVLRFVRHVNDVINRQVLFGDKVYAPVDYLITVSAAPSGALFEGTVRYDDDDRTFRVLDDISRINLYGNQSACISNARLRKFCYCKHQKRIVHTPPQANVSHT